jgi:hypothetical protein
MVLYRLTLMPMVESLYCRAPNTVTPWYANDGAITGTLPKLAAVFALLKAIGPSCGYFPEPTKSVCLHKPEALPEGQAQLQSLHFDHQTGHRYLSGHIGDIGTRNEWLQPQINH